jgi:hypothetical protein
MRPVGKARDDGDSSQQADAAADELDAAVEELHDELGDEDGT